MARSFTSDGGRLVVRLEPHEGNQLALDLRKVPAGGLSEVSKWLTGCLDDHLVFSRRARDEQEEEA